MRKALVPIDESQVSKSLIPYAFEYAKREGIQRIDFLHVIPEYERSWDYILTDVDERIIESNKKRFKSVIEEALEGIEDDVEYDLIIVSGVPYSKIIEKAEDGYEIILIGHRGLSNMEKFFIGSVAAKVVRHSPCTVLVYHPEGEER